MKISRKRNNRLSWVFVVPALLSSLGIFAKRYPGLMASKEAIASTTQKKDRLRLVVLSDTHGNHEALTHLLPPGDILLHCGDFANKGSVEDAKNFVRWLSTLDQYPEKLIIDGNHDRTLNANEETNQPKIDLLELFASGDSSVNFLQDETFTTKDGLRVHGSSWNACEVDTYDNLTPVDVWMFHRPPRLYFSPLEQSDSVLLKPEYPHSNFARGWHGSRKITQLARSHNIPLNLSGHVHMSRGVLKLKDGDSVFINASSSWSNREGARGITAPVVIDFDLRSRRVVDVSLEPHPSSW